MLHPNIRSVGFHVWLPSFFRLNFTILLCTNFSFCNAWWLLKFGSIQFPAEIPKSFHQVSPSLIRYSDCLICLLFSFDQIKPFIQLFTPVPIGSFFLSWQVSINLPFEFPRHSLVSIHHDWLLLFRILSFHFGLNNLAFNPFSPFDSTGIFYFIFRHSFFRSNTF
jgi:hypothetical protein